MPYADVLMSMLTRVQRRVSRLAARHSVRRMLTVHGGQGVVSLSFDDVPLSACMQGAAMLEAAGGRGSFFVCGGLTDQDEAGQRCHSVEVLQQLASRGHELGCHTYAHVHCPEQTAEALQREWARNRAFFAGQGLPVSRGFAFPFGDYDWRSKRLAGQVFEYARLTGGGVQVAQADLLALQAVPLYAQRANLAELEALIMQTARQRGWLIVYTHEVSPVPGPWGITPQALEQVLCAVKRADCRLLSIAQAIDYFRSSPPRPFSR